MFAGVVCERSKKDEENREQEKSEGMCIISISIRTFLDAYSWKRSYSVVSLLIVPRASQHSPFCNGSVRVILPHISYQYSHVPIKCNTEKAL